MFSVSTEGPFLLKAQGPLGGYSVDDLDAINQKKDSDNTPKIKNKNSELNDNTDKRKKTTSKYSTNLKTKMSMSLTDADSDSGMSTQDTYNGAPNSIGRIFSLLSKVIINFKLFELNFCSLNITLQYLVFLFSSAIYSALLFFP